MTPGRNDPCPCGSGKKYKKCCIPKYDAPVAVAGRPVVSRVISGISSTSGASDSSRSDPAVDRLESLASQLTPLHAQRKMKEKLDLSRIIWKTLKEKFLVPNGFRSFKAFHEAKQTLTDFEWFVSDYVMDLRNESIGKEQAERDRLLEEGIAVCREFIELLPETDLHNLLNFRRDMADLYAFMEDYEQAERLFEQLTEEHPDWTWGYIGWGEMYEWRSRKGDRESDREKAASIWRMGLERCTEDREALEERLKHLRMS